MNMDVFPNWINNDDNNKSVVRVGKFADSTYVRTYQQLEKEKLQFGAAAILH